MSKQDRPACDRQKLEGLTLRELGSTASAAKTVLLAFFHAAVAGEESAVAKRLEGVCGELLQGTGDAELARIGLTRRPAAMNANQHVNLLAFAGLQQRGQNRGLLLNAREVGGHFALVDHNFALAGPKAHTGDSRLSAACSEDVVRAVALNNRGFCHGFLLERFIKWL
jgi:hypothetical protein